VGREHYSAAVLKGSCACASQLHSRMLTSVTVSLQPLLSASNAVPEQKFAHLCFKSVVCAVCKGFPLFFLQTDNLTVRSGPVRSSPVCWYWQLIYGSIKSESCLSEMCQLVTTCRVHAMCATVCGAICGTVWHFVVLYGTIWNTMSLYVEPYVTIWSTMSLYVEPYFIKFGTVCHYLRHFMALFVAQYISIWGTRCRSWLRHCATSRKDAG
jgi:hypothetical protein